MNSSKTLPQQYFLFIIYLIINLGGECDGFFTHQKYKKKNGFDIRDVNTFFGVICFCTCI